MININDKDTRKSRLIFDARIARKLLKMGFVVTDIKPNRENTDKSIFIFENTEEFKQALSQVLDEFEARKELEQITVDAD